MSIEQTMDKLQKQMIQTDERLDTIVIKVNNIETNLLTTQLCFNNDDDDNGTNIEVNNLLKSVNEVKNNYQTLHKDLLEVQYLQKELTTTLHYQLQLMQNKFDYLKRKLQIKTSNMSSKTIYKN